MTNVRQRTEQPISEELSSASAASMVHASLQASGLLKQTPGQGGICAN